MSAKLAPGYIQLETADITALTNPPSGSFLIALDSGNSNKLTRKDSSGTETVIEGGGGGSFTSFTVAADSGSSQTITDGNTLTIVGGTGIDTVASATDTITINIDATVATLTGSQSLTNKTLDNTNAVTLKDNSFTLQDNTDATKQLVFELSGITTATTRTVTIPDADFTIVGVATTQTLTNKTLTTPKIAQINDTNGNESVIFTATGSAVNEVTLANAATGNGPSITASGGDTNIDLVLSGKGTGGVKLSTPLNMNDQQIQKALYVDLKRGTAPADPSTGYLRIYALDSDGHTYQRTSAGSATDLAGAGGGSGLYSSLVVLRYTLASGTDGGGTSAGAYTTYPLNEETADPSGICTLSSNQFTLTSGNYDLDGWFTIRNGNDASLRLYDVTNTAAVDVRTTSYAPSGSTVNQIPLAGYFTLAGSTTLRIEYKVGNAQATNGLGLAISHQAEVYAVLKLRKLS